MKVTLTKAGTYTIAGISQSAYNAMSDILNTANDRCFDNENEDGTYYSNEDFVCTLDKQERNALRTVCEKL